MGTDAYKEMWPNSIWPSTLPSIPPVSIFTLTQNIVHLQPHGQLKKWDLAFPTDIELIGEGAFGTNISAFYDLGFTPADGASVGRVFVQFSNLLAWDPEEDEDGCHDANRFCVLPPHFLNLRVGKIDPAVLPHVITEESLAQFPPLRQQFHAGPDRIHSVGGAAGRRAERHLPAILVLRGRDCQRRKRSGVGPGR